MQHKTVKIAGIEVANNQPFTLFGGMNVLESRDMALKVAEHYAAVCQKLDIPLVQGLLRQSQSFIGPVF